MPKLDVGAYVAKTIGVVLNIQEGSSIPATISLSTISKCIAASKVVRLGDVHEAKVPPGLIVASPSAPQYS
jgi:hypothetical protein